MLRGSDGASLTRTCCANALREASEPGGADGDAVKLDRRRQRQRQRSSVLPGGGMASVLCFRVRLSSVLFAVAMVNPASRSVIDFSRHVV